MTVAAETNARQAYRELADQARARWQDLWSGEKAVVTVGMATCGRAAGAAEVLVAIEQEITAAGVDATVIAVGCLGHCYAEPLVNIAKPGYPTMCYGYVTPAIGRRLVRDFLVGDDPGLEFTLGALEQNDIFPSILDQPRFQFERRIVLKNCGLIDPEDIYQYIANGGYRALVRALEMGPAQIITAISASGLRGRGGAGFPTGQKWETARLARRRPKYVIANADEGDPGAFMDRAILESDPHAVIEGLLIAALASGASRGFLYVRSEYPLAVQRGQTALRQCRELGLVGHNILGSEFSCEIELFQGSGAFVCGEETALIASLEGKPGLPRHRPPYPATAGLGGKPTLVDNVKTLASVAPIIDQGAAWFASIGTEKSPGTAVFALAGKVLNTGLVEVPMGTTLRQLIFDVGGGVPHGKRFKAVQIGGPSGGCLPASALDQPIDFDSLPAAGAMMGSGGLVVLDEDDCMVEMARFFLDFTQRESCGQCTMCRLGTKQMLAILQDITQGRGQPADLDRLAELAPDIQRGSLCGLGKTAPNPVLTTLNYFRDEYEAHIREGRCPGLMCPDLIAYYIIPEKCDRSCDVCVGTCTVEAVVTGPKRTRVIDQEKCVKCNACLEVCPPQYRAIVKLSPPSLVPGSE